MPPILYLRWKDAAYTTEDTDHERLTLIELEEVGFLIHEDDESITLGPEWHEGCTSSRLTLTIPRVNILEAYALSAKGRRKFKF